MMNKLKTVTFLIYLCCQVHTKPLVKDEKTPNNKQVEFLERIIPVNTRIGQVGGLDTDQDGNLVVFHRGSRKWAFDSFFNDNFNTFRYGPIKEDVLSLINTETMSVTDSWGSNKFYMPHGLTIDSKKNFWFTDVGLHQVFKYDFKISFSEPVLTLGERFKKGNDQNHFCKPTSVAVSQLNEDIFIADGYCNRRIAQYDLKGNFIKNYEDNDEPMIVVHSLVLLETEGLVCAASREDGRIVCFDTETGNKKFVITDPSMNTVYAIEYDPKNQVIHAATGDNHNSEAFGLTFDMSPINFGKLVQKWSHKTEDLSGAHDIAVSPDTKHVYIGQLNAEIDSFIFN